MFMHILEIYRFGLSTKDEFDEEVLNTFLPHQEHPETFNGTKAVAILSERSILWFKKSPVLCNRWSSC